MALDVKKEVFDIIRDNTLSKSEKIQKILDLYNRTTGSSSGSGALSGNSSIHNDSNGGKSSDNGSGNGSDSGDQNGQGDQQGQSGQGNQQGQGGQNGQSGQNGQGNQQGQGSQSGQNGQQGQGGQSGQQGQNGQNGQSGQQGQGNQQGQGAQNGQQGKNGQGNQQGQGGQSGQQAQNGQNGQSGQGGQRGQNTQGNQQGQGGQNNQNGQQGQGGQQGQQSQNAQQGQSGQQGQQSQNGQQGQGGQNNQNAQQGQSGQQGQQGQGGQQGQQNQNGQQGQSGQQGQGNQQGQQGQSGQQGQQSQQSQSDFIPDEYEIGKYLGKKYAEEMFNHHGLTPILKDTMELPELDPMSIKESLNESVDIDINDILDDNSLTDDERVKKIHDLFLKDGSNQTTSLDDKNKIQTSDVPDDVVIMRNGGIPGDIEFRGDHVISQTIGDEIRKEAGVKPKDPDFGLSSDEAAMIKEAFPIIDDIFSKVESNKDDELAEVATTMKEKIKGRIRASREGIINWKQALEEFVSMKSKHLKKTNLRKNIYYKTGIGLYHREKDIKNYNKCVFYIDTSYSVNNDETQLIPVMVGEIGKVMMDCHFETVDIHLFSDSVYNEHFDVDAYTVRDENWGLEGVSGGGTNISSVYRHIISNYTDDGELDRNVDAIIIITDVSGMKTGGTVKPFLKRLSPDTFNRMLYVIYDDYKMQYLSEVRKAMGELVSSESTYYVIPLEAFKKQMIEESMKTIKRKHLSEALGGAKTIVQKKADAEKPTERTKQEKEERLMKSSIQGARALGTLDKVLPELMAKLKELFPDCESAKEMTAVMTKENSYYISDKATVVIHKDVPASLSQFFMDACKKIDFEAVIGDVTIDGVAFAQFPVNFPKQIKGNFAVRNCRFLKNFDNAPTAVTGALYLDERTINSRKITSAVIDEYANKVSKQMELGNIDGGKGVRSAFRKNESVDEMQAIIRKRIMLGESFVYERFGGLLDKPKGQLHGNDPDKWEVYNKNKEVFAKLREYITIPWGDIPEDKINVRNTVKDIRDAINKATNVEDINVARKGITVLTDEDGKISVVLANDGKDKKKSKIIYFRDYVTGEDIYDENKINDEISSRYNAYTQITKTLLDAGIDPKYISEKIERLGSTTLEICALGHLFQALLWANGANAKDYGEKILYPAKNAIGPSFNGSNKDYVDIIMKTIYGPDAKRISRSRGGNTMDDSFEISVPTKNGTTKTTVNLGSDNTNKRDIFVATAEMSLRQNQANIFQYLSDEYLKAMLKGIAIRAIDSYPKYTLDDVDDKASHDELSHMAYDLKDVLIENTALKQQSYTKSLKDKNLSDASRVLLLFPERMNDMYYFNVDVKPLTTEYMSSVMDRIASVDDKRLKGEKEPRSISARRKELETINAERVKNGEKPLTYMEFKQDAIANLRDSFNTNVKNLTNEGGLSSILDEIDAKAKAEKAEIIYKWFRKDFDDIESVLPGALDYIGEILDPNQENPSVKLFGVDEIKKLADSLSNFRKTIDDVVAENAPEEKFDKDIKVIKEFKDYIVDLVKKVLGHDSRTGKISDDVLKDTLADRTEELKVQTKNATAQTAQTAAGVNQKNIDLYNKFFNDISAIENSVPGILAAIKAIDFTKLNPKVVQRIRGGKQGLNSMISDDAAEILRLAKGIYGDAMKDGQPTGAFNWVISSASEIEQLAKDCEAIVELANDTNVSDASLLRAITSVDDKFYNLSVDLADYDNSVAQQAFTATAE